MSGSAGASADRRVLVVNPGSTSTKLGIFEGEGFTHREVLRHPAGGMSASSPVPEQLAYLSGLASRWFRDRGDSCDAVVAMGGLFRPLEGGTYLVNSKMLADAKAAARGSHASNLGCLIADALARDFGCPAFVVDPVSVDEFDPVARYSGHPMIERSSLSHALNIHAAARRAARDLGIPLLASSFVVAHLGGGISVAPVRGGRIVDVNDAAGDGPFSPERSGGLPLQPFIGLCLSGKYTEKELRAMVMGAGGLVAYLGTNNAGEVERRIGEGDVKAGEIYGAMGYQIAKEIGAAATVLKGLVDAVVLTGGLSASAMLTSWIEDRVSFIGRIVKYPGEMEMEALAEGALSVLRGEETGKEY
ncbi:MAG TPA: butyrate kinase [Bacteroidota bacterium]|nr:butyrate kinase [Bacteroidota bacterium]